MSTTSANEIKIEDPIVFDLFGLNATQKFTRPARRADVRAPCDDNFEDTKNYSGFIWMIIYEDRAIETHSSDSN